MEIIELPNQERIKTFGEKENYKYLGILEVDTIKRAEMLRKKEKRVHQKNEEASRNQTLYPVGWCGGGVKNKPTASLQLGKTPPNECLRSDTKQSDCEAVVVQELWRIRTTPSLPLLTCPLWPEVVTPDRVLYMF